MGRGEAGLGKAGGHRGSTAGGGGVLDLGSVQEGRSHQSQGLPMMGRLAFLQCKHKLPTHQPFVTEKASTRAEASWLALSTESGRRHAACPSLRQLTPARQIVAT